tara:strand:+ start:13525 stop:14463 length:939 start_codon:yes stop_codon:yes gene_type:complete
MNIEQAYQLILSTEDKFNRLSEGAVTFTREAEFAKQALSDNSYLLRVAQGNPDSLKRAITNVAAVGLSLNPVEKLAYLVPRKKAITLDISYQGLIAIACDIGSIRWALPELVYEKDTFEARGGGLRPNHQYEAFSTDRGRVVGVYCVAKTYDDEYLVTTMPIAEVYSIRDRSEAWKAYQRDPAKKCPWVTDEGEMIKKTCIRRAAKLWPRTDKAKRLETAIAEVDASEAVELNGGGQAATSSEVKTRFDEIRSLLKAMGRPEEKLLNHLPLIHNRAIDSLEELTPSEQDKTVAFLSQYAKPVEVQNEDTKAN